MFPGSSAIGDSMASLFGGPQDVSNQYYQAQMKQARLTRTGTQEQNQGVRDMPSTNGSDAVKNSPQFGNEKNRPTAAEDPMEVEARWEGRLAKYAGISQATGVKIGK